MAEETRFPAGTFLPSAVHGAIAIGLRVKDKIFPGKRGEVFSTALSQNHYAGVWSVGFSFGRIAAAVKPTTTADGKMQSTEAIFLRLPLGRKETPFGKTRPAGAFDDFMFAPAMQGQTVSAAKTTNDPLAALNH